MPENHTETTVNFEKLYKDSQQQLEQHYQELHELNRQLKISQAVVKELEDENRIVQTQIEEQQTKYEQIIQENKDKFAEEKINYCQQINSLETELNEKNIELDRLKNQLETVGSINVNNKTDNNDLLDENKALKELIDELYMKLSDFEELKESCEKKNQELETINSALKSEIDNLKEIINCKKTELDEINQMFDDLQESHAYTTAELNTLKTKPLDIDKQGNSLFAEVNDKRVQLQQNMKILKEKLIEMKHERQGCLQQITLLRNENANLVIKHKQELNQINCDENAISSSYKKQIETLQQLIERYRNDSNEKKRLEANGTDTATSFQYFNKLVDAKNKEIDQLRQQLMLNRFNHTTMRQELGKSTRTITEMEKRIGKLENEIELLKLKDDNVIIEQQQQQSNKTLSLETTSVENNVEMNVSRNETLPYLLPNKKVTFGETTISEFAN